MRSVLSLVKFDQLISVKYLVEFMRDENEHVKDLIKYQFSPCDILCRRFEVAIDLRGYINSKNGNYFEVN